MSALLLLLSLPTWMGPIAPQEPILANARELMREALRAGEAYQKLQSLVIAAPKRFAGTSGAEDALLWAEERLTLDGWQNIRREPCEVPVWKRGKLARLTQLNGSAEQRAHLPILALGGSVGTPPGGLRGPVLAVKSFEDLRALGERARGAFILFNRPMDPANFDPFEAYGEAVDQRGRGAIEAAKVGAIAALVRSMSPRIDDVPHTGAMRYEEGVRKIPAVAVSTAGAERLAARLSKGEAVELSLELDCEPLGRIPSANLVAEWQGRETPEEIVLIGGHLDAWDVGQGAHDDGAGCVQAMEVARLLRRLELRPRRTVRLVLFMNEEFGLDGALAYHQTHQQALARHVLAIESDRGGFVPRGFTTNAGASARAQLEPLRLLLSEAGAGELRKGGGGADVSPLEKAGITVMGLYPDPQRYFDLHHTSADTLDKVHPRELELGAGVLAAMTWFVAEHPTPLPSPEGAQGAR
jgi:Zn-dependent M28 family amino/carboxypeptidase